MVEPGRRGRRKVRGPRSDGARAFDDWLEAHRQTVPEFCETHGLDRFAVQHALSGRVRGVSIDLAFAIQGATAGDVSARLWRASTTRWDHEPATAPSDELDKASGE